MIGQVIGNYRLVSELGRGGMGMVYRAEHVQLGRPAAVKMLLPSLSSDASIVQRFFNEARAASAIDHPGIVEVFDFGQHEGAAYIVMALLKGESLEQRLQRGPIEAIEGASIVAQIAGALAAAHVRGIVHRDLKPDNIFLVPNELLPFGVQVKLLDFGIAKLSDDRVSGIKTQTGAMMGTPAYMSPEQCMGKADLDHRTDLYALGCILFHILCGRTPFSREQGTGMMIAQHLRDPAPDPRRYTPHLSDALAAVTLRLLEKDPSARFQSAAELRAALVAAGAHAPTTLRPTPAPGTFPEQRYTGPDAFDATTAPTEDGRTGPMAGAWSASMPSGGGPTVPARRFTGAAPTTTSGSAAQLVARERPRRAGAWLVVGGLLAAISGIGVVVAVSGGSDAPGGDAAPPPPSPAAAAPVTALAPTPPPTPPSTPPSIDPASARPAAQASPAAAPASALDEPCSEGRSRRADTSGQCCWPGQAWSMANEACVGRPSCPPGMSVKGERCIAEARKPHVVTNKDPLAGADGLVVRNATGPRPDPTTFRLDARRYRGGAPIKVRFASPVSSPIQRRAWVTVVEAHQSPSTFGTWTFVKDGARVATLTAPKPPGAYEVRLHTDYPAKATHVVASVTLEVVGKAPPVDAQPVEAPTSPEVPPEVPPESGETPRARQRFTVASRSVAPGTDVMLRFPVVLKAAPGRRFWVTIVTAGTADSSWGAYAYVPAGARGVTLAVPKDPGAYELRLHANYPVKTTDVVHRVAIRVE